MTVDPQVGDRVRALPIYSDQPFTAEVTAEDGFGNFQIVDEDGIDYVVGAEQIVVLERYEF